MKKLAKWVVYVMLVSLLCFSAISLFGFVKGCISKDLVQAFTSAYHSTFCVLLFFIMYNMMKVNDIFGKMDVEALTKRVRTICRLLIGMSVVEFISYNTEIKNGIGLTSFHIDYVIIACIVMYIFLRSMLGYISEKEV